MMAEASSSSARTGNETIARILAAAENLFAEHGFDAASMSAIAERAGVSKANVFHHFSTKHELYQAVLRHAIHEITQQLKTMSNHSGTVSTNLPEFAQSHLSNILQHDRFARLMLREILSEMPKERLKVAQQVFGENFSELVAMLRRGQERGELRANVDPAMIAMMLIGADVFFFQANNVFRHFPDVKFSDDPEYYSRSAVDILLHGILATDDATPATQPSRNKE